MLAMFACFWRLFDVLYVLHYSYCNKRSKRMRYAGGITYMHTSVEYSDACLTNLNVCMRSINTFLTLPEPYLCCVMTDSGHACSITKITTWLNPKFESVLAAIQLPRLYSHFLRSTKYSSLAVTAYTIGPSAHGRAETALPHQSIVELIPKSHMYIYIGSCCIATVLPSILHLAFHVHFISRCSIATLFHYIPLSLAIHTFHVHFMSLARVMFTACLSHTTGWGRSMSRAGGNSRHLLEKLGRPTLAPHLDV